MIHDCVNLGTVVISAKDAEIIVEGDFSRDGDDGALQNADVANGEEFGTNMGVVGATVEGVGTLLGVV